jgi:hypothetical protein
MTLHHKWFSFKPISHVGIVLMLIGILGPLFLGLQEHLDDLIG